MTNDDEIERTQENRNIVDLGAYCFGMTICVICLFLVGNIVYQLHYENTMYNIALFLLMALALVGFLAIVAKLKMLV